MRFIDLNAVIASIPQPILANLNAIDTSMHTKTDAQKVKAAKNGNVHWTPVKVYLENASNRKCWYTESKNPGCLSDVEHFRPKGKVTDKQNIVVHWYWFLAFNSINYRLSCQIPNRLNHNPLYVATGGKGNHFPLLNTTPHATSLAGLVNEHPALLDPCNQNDVDLLAFDPAGRPVVSPLFVGNATATVRVAISNLLLNLDFPTFNEDREGLYNKIRSRVERGDGYFADNNVALDDVKDDLRDLMKPDAEYSMAAECYIRGYRDRSWIDEMFI